MNSRRSFFKTIRTAIIVAAGSTLGLCQKVYGAVSKWSWPGYPSASALRNHLISSPNHPEVTSSQVSGKSLSQLASIHDASHQRRGDSPRWSGGKSTGGSSSSSKSKSKSRSKPSSKRSSRSRLTNPTLRKR